MPNTSSALERAFELASARECVTIKSIKERLRREGYRTDQIVGQTLKRQLTQLMRTGHLPQQEGSLTDIAPPPSRKN